jgi:uncharacterized protein YjbJ (UPF0337 family)
MNKDTIQGQFDQFIGAAKTQWGRLTDDDLLKVEGNIQKLKGAIQERYGLTVEEAHEEVTKWEARHPRDTAGKSYT